MAKGGSSGHLDKARRYLNYAFDLALLSRSHSQMQEKARHLAVKLSKVGLRIYNQKDTKGMRVNTVVDTPLLMRSR